MANLQNLILSGTSYFKIPTGTKAQRPTVASGLLRFNSDVANIEFSSSDTWVSGKKPYLYYNEGNSATATNWNNSSLYNMTQFGGLGNVTAHGGATGPATFTLTLNSLPVHSKIRYRVKWHMVDSLDNETSNFYVTNNAGTEVELLRWTKLYYSNPVFSILNTNTIANWIGAQIYSYRPWASGIYNNDGYLDIDTGYYDHTLSTFSARHYLGYDQVITDEAMYLSHVEIWLVP